MGESLSVKSNQVAYVPDKSGGPYPFTGNRVRITDDSTTPDHYEVMIPVKLGTSYFFLKYFGKGNKNVTVESIPVIYKKENVSKYTGDVKTGEKQKEMYYIDFEYVADHDLSIFEDTDIPYNMSKADYIEKMFVRDYFNLFNYSDVLVNSSVYPTSVIDFVNNPAYVDQGVLLDADEIKDILKDVTYYSDHLFGEVAISDQTNRTDTKKSFSSGVLTYTGAEIFGVNEKNKYKDAANKEHTVDFKVITSKGSVIDTTLEGDTTSYNSGNIVQDTNFIENYQKHYDYVKWALQDIKEGTPDANIVDQIVAANGEGCITPINRYMNFDYISDDDNLMASNPSAPGSPTDINPGNLDLGSYKVWVSNGDVKIECSDASEKNSVTGIIIAKGDVYFDRYNGSDRYKNVNKFNGIIITGGKIYVNNDTTNINATDLCKSIITSCMIKAKDANNTENPALMAEARKACRVLTTFKAYEQYANEALGGTTKDKDTKSITNIDYSDVIRYNNWVRNVD
jgi:hypothetical protein